MPNYVRQLFFLNQVSFPHALSRGDDVGDPNCFFFHSWQKVILKAFVHYAFISQLQCSTLMLHFFSTKMLSLSQTSY